MHCTSDAPRLTKTELNETGRLELTFTLQLPLTRKRQHDRRTSRPRRPRRPQRRPAPEG